MNSVQRASTLGSKRMYVPALSISKATLFEVFLDLKRKPSVQVACAVAPLLARYAEFAEYECSRRTALIRCSSILVTTNVSTIRRPSLITHPFVVPNSAALSRDRRLYGTRVPESHGLIREADPSGRGDPNRHRRDTPSTSQPMVMRRSACSHDRGVDQLRTSTGISI